MFDLTKYEKGIIVFLAASFLLGCGLFYFQKVNSKFCLLSLAEEQNINSKTVNINKAAEQELIQLPGIGHILAKRIVDYRSCNGPFKKLDDLKKVSGIGDKKFERIKEFLVLE
jgi:comEA protein